MKKISLVFFLSMTVQSIMSANLLPGAHVYHLMNASAFSDDTPPVITGKILNLTPNTTLTATNKISVPNNFPATISNSGDYTVEPPISNDGFEEWTKSIEYVDDNGSGCLIQFAWNLVDKAPDIALTSLNADYLANCRLASTGPYSNGGTNISIDNKNLIHH